MHFKFSIFKQHNTILHFGFLAWSTINREHIKQYATSTTSEP